jgi:Mce-associated membrane protein
MKGTLAGTLAGITVLCTCLAVWFSVTSSPSPPNTALVDVAATKSVTDQVARAIRTVFSYDPAQLDETRKAAQEVLTSNAITQYNTLFAQAKEHALSTQQVLTTAVRSIGVIQLHGDSAQLLVFVDRQLVHGDQHESAVAQLVVNAERAGETWKITNIQVL